ADFTITQDPDPEISRREQPPGRTGLALTPFIFPENMRADISYQYVYGLAVYGNSPSGYNQGHFISNSDKSEHAQNKIAVFRSFALKAGVPKYIISEACDDGRENAKHLWRH
ncbi:hypothetical protein, partial [Gimesia chilikensis]|uniref:hypothetical protein n=1 Tax=Gimesia chilikensis TaxID=2605989 RepID=UPI003A90D215